MKRQRTAASLSSKPQWYRNAVRAYGKHFEEAKHLLYRKLATAGGIAVLLQEAEASGNGSMDQARRRMVRGLQRELDSQLLPYLLRKEAVLRIQNCWRRNCSKIHEQCGVLTAATGTTYMDNNMNEGSNQVTTTTMTSQMPLRSESPITAALHGLICNKDTTSQAIKQELEKNEITSSKDLTEN
jgi:hypothetical protein